MFNEMKIEIIAVDTLFFRDGKPFSSGEETWADGIFPPFPSVIYGALRTAYFSENPHQLVLAQTENDPTSNLRIKGIYYKIGEDICFPSPLDCVEAKVKNEILLIENRYESISSNNCVLSLIENDKNKKNNSNFFQEYFFDKYLNNKTSSFPFLNKYKYIEIEPKIGIKRSKLTKSSEFEKLYRIGLNRLNGISIVVVFEGITIKDNGFIKLGGEGKIAIYKRYDNKILIKKPDISNKLFKLYLLTPAIFENGWLPKWIDKTSLHGTYKNIEVQLLSACIGKYNNIGGFDIKKKIPKAMYRSVPMGSVYYFQLESGTTDEIFNYFGNKSISDLKENEGFGITIIGGIK